MEKKKTSLYLMIIAGFISVLFILGAIKNIKNHHDKQYLVVHSKIKESAKLCYLKGDCEGEIILKDLYDKKYLEDKLIDPVTKENINENLCIKYENEEVSFCEK